MTPQSLKFDTITWSSTYSVGVKLIDDQHKVLVNLVNDLYKHSVGNEEEEKAYFRSVIHQAVDYVKMHFGTEEKIMVRVNFPGYKEHKKAHETFITTVLQKSRDFEADKRLTLSEFAKFLKDWILSHIAFMDKQYVAYFKEIATRKADGKLSITLDDLDLNR